MNIKIDINTLYFEGDLTLKSINHQLIEQVLSNNTDDITKIDISKVGSLDTAGAYIIITTLNTLKLLKNDILNASPKNKNLIDVVDKNYVVEIEHEIKKRKFMVVNSIFTLGKGTNSLLEETKISIAFLGSIALGYLNFIKKPYKSFFSIVLDITYDSTIKALGIVILLSLIIGLVLTYLPLNMMMQYGTQIYVIDMLGISSFREFAPLFTAIIIAGRSGSAFTSEIGMMKVNEEIDALQTIGEDPIQRLVLPRITALMISLPILAVIAMIGNIIGGMVITYAVADITPYQFITRLFTNVGLANFVIGVAKTPLFALVIAGVGCMKGMTVKRDSQSVGRSTTASVVYSIFLIIVVDAIFAIGLSGIS